MRFKHLILSNLVILTCIIGVVIAGSIFLSHRVLYQSSNDTLSQKYQINDANAQGKTAQSMDDGYLIIIMKSLETVGLSNLRDTILPEGATEIRFWVGFSHGRLSALIIKHDGATWSATFIPKFSEGTSSSDTLRSLSPPASGWQHLMDRLQQLGLYDLSGESGKIPEKRLVLDVTSTVVEIKTSNSYKLIRHNGVFYFQDEEIIKMERILQALSSEFSIKLY